MIEFSSSLNLNEIHIVDSSFNEDSQIITFSREAIISRKGRSENLGKMSKNRVQIGGGQFRISAPTLWCQNPCDASIFLRVRPNFRGKK